MSKIEMLQQQSKNIASYGRTHEGLVWDVRSSSSYEVIIMHWKRHVSYKTWFECWKKKKRAKINNLKKVKDLGMIIDVKFKEIVKAVLDL